MAYTRHDTRVESLPVDKNIFVFISGEQVPHGNAIKEDISERLLVPEYELGKRPLFPDYEDDESQDLLERGQLFRH